MTQTPMFHLHVALMQQMLCAERSQCSWNNDICVVRTNYIDSLIGLNLVKDEVHLSNTWNSTTYLTGKTFWLKTMTNLINTCFILQYVYYNPLHVSSIICSSSGGWILLMQHLVSSLSVSGRSVHRLRENSLSTCALNGHWLRELYQMLHQCNYPPDDENLMLETRSGT